MAARQAQPAALCETRLFQGKGYGSELQIQQQAAALDGVVATQHVKQGQAVQAGQSLLTLLPGDGRLEAELLAPSRAIGFIEPGDRVLLRYQAFPYQKFGHHQGRVVRISRSAVNADNMLAYTGAGGYAGAQASEPLYSLQGTLADG